MNLAELQTEVYTQTNLPHLVNETLSAIRSATLKLHQRDFFVNDLREEGISFATAENIQNFEYKLLFPRWRALKYFRRALSDGTVVKPTFEVIDPTNFMDQYNVARTNVAYVAGSYVQIYSKEALQYAVIGFYEHPNTTVASYSSWIARDFPYAIVHEAAATVFAAVGDTEQARSQKVLGAEHIINLTNSSIQGVGY